MLVIDNERVSVWDMRLKPGEQAHATPADMDRVFLFVDGGGFEMVTAAETIIRLPAVPGYALFAPKDGHDPILTSPGRHQLAVIALKDNALATSDPSPSPAPPGARKMLSTKRVAVWRHTPQPGASTPFADKDVIAVQGTGIHFHRAGGATCVPVAPGHDGLIIELRS